MFDYVNEIWGLKVLNFYQCKIALFIYAHFSFFFFFLYHNITLYILLFIIIYLILKNIIDLDYYRLDYLIWFVISIHALTDMTKIVRVCVCVCLYINIYINKKYLVCLQKSMIIWG